MTYIPLSSDISSADFNSVVHHPLQSYEWGEFRKKTGIMVIRDVEDAQTKLQHAFTLTLHPIPHTKWNIGYLPRGEMPDDVLIQSLREIGKEYNCIFIQLEPNVSTTHASESATTIALSSVCPAAHPLFTKYTLQIDLTKSEEELLQTMHSKTRYNIRVAQKHEVTVQEDNSDRAFEEYLRLITETTKRQGFYAHSEKYHRTQWETIPHTLQQNHLSSHLFTATYHGKILTTWIVFIFHNMMYYPYGASSSEYRETMHSTLMMWEVIRFGKKQGLKIFDLWGALGENADPKDPWYGFHRFKSGFGPSPVEFIGSYDLVINPLIYKGYAIADKLRWMYLRLKK